MMIRAEELCTHHKVISESGEKLKIMAITRGMISNHIHLRYSNGEFSEVPKGRMIEVMEK